MDVRGLFLKSGPPQPDWRSRIPCQFFAHRSCRNGTNCQYSHAAEGNQIMGIDTGPSTASRPPRDPTPQVPRVPCRFFQRGSCSKGENCPFAHSSPQDAAGAGTIMEREEARAPESWCRELKGALVSFGDGAVVTKVSFPSDFSAVRLSGLPPNTTASSVVALLDSLNFAVPKECVRILASTDNTHRSAMVRVEDPHFAKRLYKLSAMKGHDTPEVLPIKAPMPHTTNYRQVDSRKVHCSWHKPTKTAWLNFGSRDIAATVSSRFSAGIYKVLFQTVQCEGPTRSAGHRNPLAWTIRLSDVPISASKEHVTRDVPAALGPRHVEMSKATYDVDLPLANTLVESLLLQAGPLERWEGSLNTTKKRCKARAWFMNDADARQAVKLLHNKPLPFHKNGKLTVQFVHSAKLKIPTRVYDAIEQEIEDQKQAWESQHLLYMAYPPVQGLRVLKIEGEASKDVAGAKATLESIIGGRVVMRDGKAMWAPSFAANGRVHQRMKQLERELGILIIRDRRRSQLRLLGPQSRCEEAQPALLKLAEAESSSVFVMELDAQQFSRAFNGGYRAVAAAIGEDKVILDIVSTPRRVLVAGSEADFHVAQEILLNGEGVPNAKPEASLIRDCVICWTEAENPVSTPCKHVYCAGCFEDLCFAGASSEPCIRCQGDAGKCGELFLLAELQAHLSSAALEDIFETAFATHITRHRNDLNYCPTPDCGQMYRATRPPGRIDGVANTGESPLFLCPVCLVAVCTACNVSHDGLTCAEHRDRTTGGHQALLAAKEKLGIKDCPKCGIMIEKTFGCNHMTCSACGTHICWVCMETFPTGGLVYNHMNRDHGGIGVQYPPDLV